MDKNQLRSALWMLGWALFFTLTMVIVKQVGNSIGLSTLIFIRLLFGLLFSTPLLLQNRKLLQAPKQLPWYAASIAISTVARFATYYAYNRLPLALATSIGYTTPFIVATFSVVFLGLRISLRQWTALLLGYMGVIMMIQPGQVVWDQALAAAFLANTLAAMGSLIVKQLTKTESTEAQILYRTLPSLLIMGVFAYTNWNPLQPRDWLYLSAAGFFGFASQYCNIRALKWGTPYITSSVGYARLLFSIPLGSALFSEIPSYWLGIGSLCIIAANMYLVLNQRNSSTD